MTSQRYLQLLSCVGPSIKRHNTRLREAIHPDKRLAITLRYLVTGDSMQTISCSYRVGHSTVCGIIEDMCHVLWSVFMPDYIRTLTSEDEWRHVCEGFEHTLNFPHCIGAIDGKHIVMQAPSHSGSTFF